MTFRQEMQRQVGNQPPMTGLAESASGAHRAQRSQLAVLAVAVAVAATVVGWLLVYGESDTRSPASPSGPALVSQTQLEELASSTVGPVYWAGPREGFSYELTRTADGRTYLRYLPHGVAAGDRRAEFLAVGTYSRPGSFADLQRAANRSGSVSVKLSNRGLMVSASDRPKSVYLGYPGAEYQVEVFAPSSTTARRLVLSGTITPIR